MWVGLLAADTDIISWERLSGVSGGVVLAMAVFAFVKGWILPASYLDQWKQLYEDAKDERDKNAQRLEETIELFKKLVEVNEGLKDKLEEQKQQITNLTAAVKEKGA